MTAFPAIPRLLSLLAVVAVAAGDPAFRAAAAEAAPAPAAPPAAGSAANGALPTRMVGLPAAVAELTVLAEQGAKLRSLCAALRANVQRAQAAQEAHAVSKPASDANPVTASAWRARNEQLQKAVEDARGAVARFDSETFPEFQSRVQSAIQDLQTAVTMTRPSQQQARRAQDAASMIDVAVAAIEEMQGKPRARQTANANPNTPNPTAGAPATTTGSTNTAATRPQASSATR